MKKKVKDLTLKEIENICMKNHNYKDECLDTCPFSENASACWIACALLDDEEISVRKKELNLEIEVKD